MQPLALALPTTHAFSALRGLVDRHGLNWTQVTIAATGSVVMLLLVVFLVDAHDVPQARLHHPLHLIRYAKRPLFAPDAPRPRDSLTPKIFAILTV